MNNECAKCSEAQAEIARLHDQVGDWIVRADEANARADRMEADAKWAVDAIDEMADAIDALIDEIEVFRGMKQSPSRKMMDMAVSVRDRLFRRAGHIPGNARVETRRIRAALTEKPDAGEGE